MEVLGADALRYFLLREIPFGQDGNFSFDALVQRYNGDLANGYGNLVSRVVNMVHKYFGGVVPEAGTETDAADGFARKRATRTIAAFGPDFDELNFSEALKALWTLVAETDGYLTANAPWKKPAERSDADHALLQARVLATAAEAIRVITALVYPILPDSASKVWRQLGQGEIADAAKQSFLTNLAWGGLKAGTKFGEPAPLFPRAEKDAVDRMQNLEDENSRSAVEAASQAEKAPSTAPEAPPSSLPIAPAPPPASPSVNSVQNPSNEPGAGAPQQSERSTESKATTPTHAPVNPEKPAATTHVNQVPAELASSRLSTTPAAAPADAPLDRRQNAGNENPPDPSAAPHAAGADHH